MIALPYAHGHPPIQGRLRVAPEDFQVREELGFALDGVGEHVWLWVRKRGANTEWVARRLAERAGVPSGAVSYAGMKDRHAVTEQWFSVHLPGKADPDWNADPHPDFTVLNAIRHSRKLRRGALSGNAFCITVRDLQGDPAELTARLECIIAMGVPHYFGEQRFGREAGNLERAEALLSGREKVRDRHQRGLYLSAARSALFNAVLARRVVEDSWHSALPGEALMLAGSHSFFTAEVVDEMIRQRVAAFDVHPSGPLWGAGELRSSGAVRELEEAVAEQFPIFRDGLAAAGLEQERRALRLVVETATLEYPEASTAVLNFRLPAGAYATTVLRELIEELPAQIGSNGQSSSEQVPMTDL
ncbi:MAG TPA: tRNA pseudouridine(13) synthase TruD [Candidatus Competibacteraceae bacterium]|nr:tRNA pseudouridine(13) synthase TruD [Candidatus Competibacteraceae bacterium]HRZ05381.1 tRNA pseudouridine(13) synthase TruD [Candidatus Competibacteraceae bacterium]HSA47623.1 tRNA pseudouridine(13) synthase TruD [Candidatus Competibacteraceae bacterium]